MLYFDLTLHLAVAGRWFRQDVSFRPDVLEGWAGPLAQSIHTTRAHKRGTRGFLRGGVTALAHRAFQRQTPDIRET